MGFLLLLLGGGALGGLFQAAVSLKFDTLLVVSRTIYNVITGLRGIALGFGQMLLGLGQMLAFAGLALVSVAAVLAVLSGAVRVGRNALPQLGILWRFLAGALQGMLQLLSVPLGIGSESVRPRVARSEAALPSTSRFEPPLRRRVA